MRPLILAVIVVGLAPCTVRAAAPVEAKRELLSDHKTVARLTKIEAARCRGLTALCPDRCGHSGDFATFEVVAYLHYAKPGEYGDPKSKSFTFQTQDNNKAPKIPAELAAKLAKLRPGDLVLLHWHHDYVTHVEAGGGSSQFPERPVVALEKLTQAEAEKLMKRAPVDR